MSFKETIRVPVDRVGVLIGRNGKVRKRIQQ
jgi:rRNA processing protein Krr1/Pno1